MSDDEELYVDESPIRTTHACAECEQHIDGEEVLRRTKDGWMPFHPACAPEADAVAQIPMRLGGGTYTHTSRRSRMKF